MLAFTLLLTSFCLFDVVKHLNGFLCVVLLIKLLDAEAAVFDFFVVKNIVNFFSQLSFTSELMVEEQGSDDQEHNYDDAH